MCINEASAVQVIGSLCVICDVVVNGLVASGGAEERYESRA